MARTAGRNAEETRKLILAAATRLVGQQGRAVSIAEIARAAGVSKGGLLYHFASKDELLRSLAASLVDEFREKVFDFMAQEEGSDPGKLTRAYIRASFQSVQGEDEMREDIRLASELMFEPSMQEVVQRDADQWRTQLFSDGLNPAIVRVVVAASDGNNAAVLWGTILNREDRTALERNLIAMTYEESSLLSR